MKRFFTLLFSVIFVSANAQTVCGFVNENGTLTLTAPPGMSFNSIVFASYGTPNTAGGCGAYTLGGCHATGSASVVGAVFIGHNSASIDATNANFTDPCGGTVKMLAVEAAYSAALPLKLVSFLAQKTADGKIKLEWVTNSESNTDHFIIEKSTDGRGFEIAGTVPAKGQGNNSYDFTPPAITNTSAFYYRIRMVDKDGHFTFSNSLRLNNPLAGATDLIIYPNPVKEMVTISGLAGKGYIRLLDMQGKLLKQTTTAPQTISLSMNLSQFGHGVYMLQYVTDKLTISQKLVKQ